MLVQSQSIACCFTLHTLGSTTVAEPLISLASSFAKGSKDESEATLHGVSLSPFTSHLSPSYMSASPRWHLAQLNIGRVRAPMTDPLMAGFVAELESVNALADSAPGFIWRLQTEAGDATAIRPYDDDTILINMSMWETVEALKAYVYRTHHADVMRQREKWFERLDTYFIALWWVPAGTIPTVLEAKLRLDHLRQHGESPYAFSFKKVYPPATESSEAVTISGKTADSA
jgi:hypothetical protein